MLEEGQVGRTRARNTHIDIISCLFKDDFGDQLDTIDQLAGVNHHLVRAIFLAHHLAHVVIFKVLHKLI